MSITTYTELKSAIADFLNRDDLTSVIPTFISLAEIDINRTLRHWRQEKRSTAVLDTQYSELPSDFLEPIRLSITSNDTHRLELIGSGDLLQRRENSKDTSGLPRFYALTGGAIEVYPTPDASYTLQMVYYSKPAALSGSNANNWVLTNHPDAYLYASLVHSAPYLENDARLAVWSSLKQKAFDDINSESEKAKTGGSGSRIQIRSY